ncbi:MAG: molybdopterin converting factor subunit 1 [Pseudomonadota bacterium]
MKVVYFAWLRERIGLSEEVVEADGLATVADLVARLRDASEAHALAFEDMAAVRVAVNMKVADYDAPLAGATEVAFFPPMTGG